MMYLRVGKESLMDENGDEDEIEQELALLAVQLAYVQQLHGDTQAAMVAYLDMVKRNFADISTLVVATNNLIALRGPKDMSNNLKKIDRLLEKRVGVRFQLTSELERKFSVKQK
ncbi:hypothetical protein RND81_13G091900 [Saponaria officinalis]|uniref:Uncharacterized protein n=1 Tax=Saponaria officinalis TaxID=3572 RepID=A0AAW1GXP0_SAPOF